MVKELTVTLPDDLATALHALVVAGWFASESEVARLALAEFVHRQRFALQERQQQADIAWALHQRPAP